MISIERKEKPLKLTEEQIHDLLKTCGSNIGFIDDIKKNCIEGACDKNNLDLLFKCMSLSNKALYIASYSLRYPEIGVYCPQKIYDLISNCEEDIDWCHIDIPGTIID